MSYMHRGEGGAFKKRGSFHGTSSLFFFSVLASELAGIGVGMEGYRKVKIPLPTCGDPDPEM